MWLGLAWLLGSLALPLDAAPPDTRKEDKKAEPHPASTGRLAVEKIAAASDEGKQAMSGFRKPQGWQVSDRKSVV